MCKVTDSHDQIMKSSLVGRPAISRLIGTVERTATEIARVAEQRRGSSTSCSSQDGNPEGATHSCDTDTKDKPTTPKDIKRQISPIEVGDMEEHGKSDNNGSSTIGTRAKRRRRHQRGSAAGDSEVTEKGHKRTVVCHNYHDYATNPGKYSSPPLLDAERKGRGGITSPFPLVLHDMLDRAVSEGVQSIVSWKPHGRGFLVHDQDRFVKEIMPILFRQSRFSSFQRQLSLYGFLRLTRKGPDHGVYYHELFIRGLPSLCAHMSRTRVKGYGVRQSSSPTTEPDFYQMPVVGNSTSVDSTTEKANASKFQAESGLTPMGSSGGNSNRYTFPNTFPVMPPSNMQKLPQSFGPTQIMKAPLNLATGSCGLAFAFGTGGVMKFPPMPPLRSALPSPSLYGVTGTGKGAGLAAATKSSPAIYDIDTASKQIALNLKEQHDLAVFLSDVDLNSDEEDESARGRVYRDEQEMGKIYAHTTHTAPRYDLFVRETATNS